MKIICTMAMPRVPFTLGATYKIDSNSTLVADNGRDYVVFRVNYAIDTGATQLMVIGPDGIYAEFEEVK